MNPRLLILLAALALLALTACDDDGSASDGDTASGDTAGDTAAGDTTEGDTANGDTTEGDTTEGDTTEGDTAADTSADVEPPPLDAITVSDQTLADLSTVVTIDEAALSAAGWVVLHEDDATAPGTPGRIVGFAPLPAAGARDLVVATSRPMFDETLHAMLHVDEPADGQFTFDGQNGEDMPAVQPDDALIMDSFAVTVPAGTPAVRFTVAALGTLAYTWPRAEPALYEAWIGTEPDNQTLFPQWSWRYEIVNQGAANHPIELITRGATRPEDVVLLSQDAGVTGTFEADPEVDWVEDGNRVRFTMAGALPNALDGYRCAVPEHDAMRGIIDAPSP